MQNFRKFTITLEKLLTSIADKKNKIKKTVISKIFLRYDETEIIQYSYMACRIMCMCNVIIVAKSI